MTLGRKSGTAPADAVYPASPVTFQAAAAFSPARMRASQVPAAVSGQSWKRDEEVSVEVGHGGTARFTVGMSSDQ